MRSGLRVTSANRPSVGRNVIAKLVVAGGQIHFSLIFLASALIKLLKWAI